MFVAKIVPGGQSQRAGLRENDKILKINNKVGHFTPDSSSCLSNAPSTQVPSNVNEAVGFIKKAGRNMLLTIERPDVTQEPGDQHLSVIKFAHDDVRVPEPGREREELQHCVWWGPEQAPVTRGIQLRIRGEAMSCHGQW